MKYIFTLLFTVICAASFSQTTTYILAGSSDSTVSNGKNISYACNGLLNEVNIAFIAEQEIDSNSIKSFIAKGSDFIAIVAKRSDELVNTYTRFGKFIGANRFEAVTPVFPPDILGVYVLIPNPTI